MQAAGPLFPSLIDTTANNTLDTKIMGEPSRGTNEGTDKDELPAPDSPRTSATASQIGTLSLYDVPTTEEAKTPSEQHESDEERDVEMTAEEGETLIQRRSAYEREVLSEKRKSQIRSYKHRESKDARSKRRAGREQQRISSSGTNSPKPDGGNGNSGGVEKSRARRRVRFAV